MVPGIRLDGAQQAAGTARATAEAAAAAAAALTLYVEETSALGL